MQVLNIGINTNTTQAKNKSVQGQTNFLQIAQQFLGAQSTSQTIMVPGNFNEEAINLFKDKQEIEKGHTSLEELMEDKVDCLMDKIRKILGMREVS